MITAKIFFLLRLESNIFLFDFHAEKYEEMRYWKHLIDKEDIEWKKFKISRTEEL